MSKTLKRIPRTTCRNPRGRIRAIQADARPKSIPPHAWDDKMYDNHCYIPFRAASNMLEQGFPAEEIIRRLRRKFHLQQSEAEKILSVYT